jgi:eukaryotic-like serine/threonine-protein kinase
MIGEKLGNYTIVEIVGSGSMGTVYRAEDPDGRPVAVKFVRSQILSSMAKRERFLQCLLTSSLVRHEGICPILEIGDDNDDFFVIMPFVQAQTLEQYMGKGPVPWTRALSISTAIASALEALHNAGAPHRGLKPANIWIRDAHEPAIMLSDCCVARFTEIARRGEMRSCSVSVDFADTLIPLGALAYMSPEQVRGDTVDFRTDIFSFGVVLYEMLTGRHPFDAQSSLSRISAILEAEPPPLDSLQPPVRSQLDPIVRRALAKNPDDRYQSIRAFTDDLKRVQQDPATDSTQTPKRSGIRNWLFPRLLERIARRRKSGI